ncbi:MAG: S-layer homology domain-containing protein [Caldisericaceae bacterium]|nr:S-layer homology domain-containing protein [Caldisericaceae bacterium]
MKKVLALTLAVMMVLVFFAVRPASVSAAGFPDVPANYWAKKHIDYLVGQNVLVGFPDGTFKPENAVTREQFAKMIVVAKGLSLSKPATPTYSDVSKSRWSYGYVEAASKAGYIKGYGGGKFGPADPITREQLAVLEIRVLGKEEASQASSLIIATFSNDEAKISSWARGAMTLAVRPDAQLLKWDKERNIRPKAAGTRAECAYSIYMILKPPAKGGQVSIATSEEPKTLFDALDSSAVMYEVLGAVAEGASSTLPSGKLYPIQADYIPSVSKGTWIINEDGTMKTTWKLKKGIKWSDGQPVTAKDYVFGYDMYLNDAVQVVSRDVAEKVAKVETPDDYTLVVYWTAHSIWAQYSPLGAGVYPAHILKPILDSAPENINSCDYNLHPVYSGAYKVKTWSPGNYIILEKNPNYWAGEGLLDTFVYYVTPDTNTMLMQLLAGKLDMTMPGIGIDVPQADAAEKNGLTRTFDIRFVQSVYWEHVTLNLDDPIMKDVNLRKALMFALDRQEMSRKIFSGKRDLSYGPMPGGMAAFNKDLVGMYPYDPAKARDILTEAGYTWDSGGALINPEGKEVTIDIEGPAGYAVREQEIAFMLKYWKDNLGISGSYKPMSWGPMIDTWYDGNFQACLFAWGSDPAGICSYTLYHTSQIPTEENGWAGQNFTHIRDSELDKWLTICNDSVDDAIRIDASKKIQAIVYDQLPELYLNLHVSVWAIRKGLIGTEEYDLNAITPSSYNAQYWYWEK